MKRFLMLVRKEMLHTWRDKRSLFVIIATPITMVLIFGYAIRTELRETPIAFYDKSNDELTRQIKNKISSSRFFVRYHDVSSVKGIEEQFIKTNLKAVVVFENDFSAKVVSGNAEVQIILNSSEPNISATVLEYLAGILRDTETLESAGTEKPPLINPVIRMMYNPKKQSAFFFVPGVIAIVIMLLGQKMSSIAIVREKERGTISLLYLSPVPPYQIMLAKILPYLLVTLATALMCFLMSYFLFDMPFLGSIGLLTVETILYIGVVLSLGILIASFTKNQEASLIISIIGALVPSYVLGGYVFPIESMPVVLQWISHTIPAKWYIIIIRTIMLKGLGFESVWQESIILFCMMMVFLLLSIGLVSSREK